MRTIFAFMIFTLLLYSCGKENSVKVVEKPVGLIEKPQMINVLIDFHLAEEFIKQGAKRNSKLNANRYYYSLFEKHNITATDFKNSVDYYTQLPEEFDAMYADIIKELEKLQAKLNAKENDTKSKKPKKVEDKKEGVDNESSRFKKQIDEKALQNAKPKKKS